LTRDLHQVEGSNNVRLDIGARIFEAVPHASLRGQMNDYFRGGVPGGSKQKVPIFQHPFNCVEVRILQQHLVAPPFQGDIVVICHPVESNHLETCAKQLFCQVKSDKPCGAGHEYCAH